MSFIQFYLCVLWRVPRGKIPQLTRYMPLMMVTVSLNRTLAASFCIRVFIALSNCVRLVNNATQLISLLQFQQFYSSLVTMKQLISQPSTRPQQFLYTDFSVVSSSKHPKYALSRIIAYIKNVLKMRLYLCKRDIEEIYNVDGQFFVMAMNSYSADELWAKVSNNQDDILEQRQIIGFLTKIVLQMTRQKNECAENKKFDKFAQLKNTIEWLEDRIVELEAIIRNRIKEAATRKRTESQLKRKAEFKQQAQAIKQTLQENVQRFEYELMKNHLKQKKNLESTMAEQIETSSYVFKPNKNLTEAKDESLLAKLSPFKSEKKRPFQCKSLQKKLDQSVEESKQKIEREKRQYKFYQRQKLRNRHSLQRDVYLDKLEAKNNQTIAKLEMKMNEIDRSEQIKMKKLVEGNNRLTNERVELLKKSLRSYSDRNQERQIRSIMKHHRETIQFVNNIKQIAEIPAHNQTVSPKYCTLDLDSDWTKQRKSARYSDERLEKKILRNVKNQSINDDYFTKEETALAAGRRSLVSLYDDNLKQI